MTRRLSVPTVSEKMMLVEVIIQDSRRFRNRIEQYCMPTPALANVS